MRDGIRRLRRVVWPMAALSGRLALVEFAGLESVSHLVSLRITMRMRSAN